ncbi:MAG: DUF2157 domain-containing protein [Oscillospiraceae bacterium]|nr:DUF2157 domain-containing protein [Oscillospiraceae bacterium]
MAKISKNIKKLRKEKNLTQDALAEKLNVTRQAISNWENDKTRPDIDTLERMAAALEVEPEELLYGAKKTANGEPDKSKQRNLIKIVLAIVGSISIGIGLVLIFFRFWSDFPLTVQTVFSIIPMLIGQGFAVFVFLKKRYSTAWRESAAVLWLIGIISTVALINSVFNIHCGYINCLVIDAILCIPIFFLLDAVSPLAVYFYMTTHIAVASYDEISIYTIISIALFAVGVLFTALISRDKDAPRGKYAQWLAAISGMIIAYFNLGNWINDLFVNSYFDITPVVFSVLAVVFLCMYILAPDRDDYTLPYKPIGIVGICLCMIWCMLSYYDKIYELQWQHLLILICIALLSLAIPPVLAYIRRKIFKDNVCKLVVCALCEAGTVTVYLGFLFLHRNLTAQILALLVAAIGITLIVYGVKAVKFLAVNGGMVVQLAVLAALYEKFGGWDYWVWGIILLIFGGVLIFINARLLSHKRLMSSLAEKEDDGNV